MKASQQCSAEGHSARATEVKPPQEPPRAVGGAPLPRARGRADAVGARRAMRCYTRVRESGSPELCIACLLVPTTLSWEEELHTETETAARMFELLDVWCEAIAHCSRALKYDSVINCTFFCQLSFLWCPQQGRAPY